MKTLPLTHHPAPHSTLHTLQRGTAASTLSWHCLVAENAAERTRGLLGRTSLPPDTLMLLSPCRFGLIHTIGVKFAIDVICLDKNFRVEKITRNLRPGRLFFGTLRTRHILEAQSGWLPEIAKDDTFRLEKTAISQERNAQ